MINKKLSKIFYEIANLLEIEGTAFKPKAYRKAAKALEDLKTDISLIYKEEGLKGLKKISGIGKSIAEKIEEYLKSAQSGPASGGKGKIRYYEKLKDETAIRQIVTHYFKTKGISLEQLKKDAKKRKIIYSRFTKPAKQLLELAGSVKSAEDAIDKVAKWAKSRDLDYAIETVFKKWLELDKLKPKEIVKKPFYRGNPIVWSETKRKRYVIDEYGEWLEFAGKESDIEWRTIK